MTDQPASPASLVSSIAAILQAVAWPAVAALFFFLYRSKIGSLMDVLTHKIATASRVKAWQFEMETKEQEVKEALDKTGQAAGAEIQKTEIPKDQLQAAKEVNRMLADGQITDRQVVGVVQRQINSLIEEYERLRTDMPSGRVRTRKMNEVAAKMRALSLASRPLLTTLMSGQTAGERLAAICILQVAPEFEYFDWLIDRVKNEEEPFVFFQASFGVLEMVKAGAYPDKAKVKEAVEDSLVKISGFKGGIPDQSTIDVLNMALSLLE